MGFQKRLTSGEFAILAEINTPKGVNISELVTNARRIKDRVDAVVVPDMDNGVMRLSALGGGVLMHQQGIETIMHVYCRDRNRMALQGDILAAHVLGIQNLLVVDAEDISSSDHPEARPVNDLDATDLLGAIRSLQDGVDMAGFELDGHPHFTVGCALGTYAEEGLEQAIALTKKKVDLGAQFVITPPVFDLDRYASLAHTLKDLGVPIIPTVFLLKTVGIARYMATYEPGAHISEAIITRIRKSPDRETEGIRIAGETIKGLRSMAQGVLIVTLGWEHRIPEILDHADL